MFDRRLVYAVSEILRILEATPNTSPKLRDCLENARWKIHTAWDAVLSGDIDDVLKHIAEEEHFLT